MTLFATADGIKTAFSLSGEGPPLLLLHGTGADRHMFDDIEPMLSKDFTVISYDQRDCGETEGSSAPATLAQLAADAKSLVRALGFERAHIFGSSFGGRIAQALGTLHDDVVDRLILGSTWPLPHSFADANPEGGRRMMELRAGLPGTAHDLARLFFPASFLEKQPALLDFFATVQATSDRGVRRSQAVNSSVDVRLSDISAKTLLLTGDVDLIVPPHVTLSMASEIRDCEQIVLAGVGHATCLQAPQEVASAIRPFLLEPTLAVPLHY